MSILPIALHIFVSMTVAQHTLSQQYEFVKSSRLVLLDYCATIAQEDFVKENSSFGRGSIRNLLVHCCTTYQFWIARAGLKINLELTDAKSISNGQEVAKIFMQIDMIITNFLEYYKENYHSVLDIATASKMVLSTPLQLFSHVTTHEFHHKGQVLSLSRHLGYTPVDTDIMR